MLMLFAIPSVAQNTKCFKGEFIALNSPYVIYCTHSDSEEKEKNVHFWNSKTNQTDSLFSIEAKVWNDILYYCDNNTIKKRHLSKDNNKDSILLKTQYNIENFYIEDYDIIVAEVDASSEKVNIITCIYKTLEEGNFIVVSASSFDILKHLFLFVYEISGRNMPHH